MQLDLVRELFTEKSTGGSFSIDGSLFAWSLELPVKDGLPGSAIPTGLYPVTAQWSPRFNRSMPLIEDIPNRSHILIHWGNNVGDTEGCILLGGSRPAADAIGKSRQIFDDFWVLFMGGLAKGNVLLHVQGAPQNNSRDVQEAVTGDN